MTTTPNPPAAPAARLYSLDVLRGFDMTWIIGGDALMAALAGLQGGAVLKFLARQFEHVDWAGLRCYDLIFPTFVFLVGVSIPLSLDRIVATAGKGAAVRRVVRRTVILLLVGIFYYGGFSTPFAGIRLLGVLQRIALCYGAAGLLYLALRPKGLVAVGVGLLVGYWALLRFVPVPGFGAGDFAEGHNLANWIDAHYLPLRKWDGDHDPEGLLSTLPAIVTCLIGVLAGLELRNERRTPAARDARLVAAAIGLLAAGYLWGLEFPIIKKIWTSSYVLVAGGWSMLALAAFHYLVDVRQIRGWTAPFAWVGLNPLAVYVTAGIVDFNQLAARFAGGDIGHGLDAVWPGLGAVVAAVLSIVLCFAFAGFLARHRIFLRL